MTKYEILYFCVIITMCTVVQPMMQVVYNFDFEFYLQRDSLAFLLRTTFHFSGAFFNTVKTRAHHNYDFANKGVSY